MRQKLNDRIVALFNDGASYDAIAAELSVTRGKVSGVVYRARRAGLITRGKRPLPPRTMPRMPRAPQLPSVKLRGEFKAEAAAFMEWWKKHQADQRSD